MNLKEEFEEKFCFSFMENGEKRINNVMWKSCDTADQVWEWIENKIKEARIDENKKWLDIFRDDLDRWYVFLAERKIEELEGVEK